MHSGPLPPTTQPKKQKKKNKKKKKKQRSRRRKIIQRTSPNLAKHGMRAGSQEEVDDSSQGQLKHTKHAGCKWFGAIKYTMHVRSPI